jgi:drug/metabolite transporter, DME family
VSYASPVLQQPRAPARAVSPIWLVVAAALLWSTGGLFIKLTSLGALPLSFGRCLLAAITVAILTRREGFGLNAVTALTGLLYAALLLLFVVATKLTTAANAIFLQYTAPIYILLFEPLLYREPFRWRDALTVAGCLGGMSLFFVGELRAQDVNGLMVALVSGVCFAFFTLLLRHPRAREVNRASAVIYGNLLLALVTAPWFLSAELPRARDMAALVYLGVVQIGVAYALYTQGMARGVRSLDAGIAAYIEPVLNPLWVYLFLGEIPARGAVLGGSIILASVFYHTVANTRASKPSVDTSRS